MEKYGKHEDTTKRLKQEMTANFNILEQEQRERQSGILSEMDKRGKERLQRREGEIKQRNARLEEEKNIRLQRRENEIKQRKESEGEKGVEMVKSNKNLAGRRSRKLSTTRKLSSRKLSSRKLSTTRKLCSSKLRNKKSRKSKKSRKH